MPVSPFAQYSSDTPEEVARRFTPKFDERLGAIAPAHNATTDAVQVGDTARIVGGNSAVLDSNADRLIGQQLHDVMAVRGDTRALEAARDAGRAAVLNVRSPMPTVRALDPLARTPTPL